MSNTVPSRWTRGIKYFNRKLVDHITINMEDADGNSFVVFSSKYASYKSETVAQGSGKICGISSISKGVMQLIFAQTSDFAGLTGERFDAEGGSGSGDSGEEPTPPPTGDETPTE